MTNKDDAQLVSQYFKGDEKSLEILIKKYLRPIYGFVYKYIGNVHEAEDITQDVFVKVWRNLKKLALHRIYSGAGFNPKKGIFKTWIFSIAKNTCIDWLRKKKTTPFSELEKEGEIDKFFEHVGISQLLQSTTEKLLPKYQTLLSLYYNDNLNFREIAERSGEPLNTIKSRHRRALIILRKDLDEF
jgi:RNA polymerase sigma-70 factor (ECF subfamily)